MKINKIKNNDLTIERKKNTFFKDLSERYASQTHI